MLSPDHSVKDVLDCKKRLGFCGIPITHDGKMGGRLVGIVTSGDIDFLEDKKANCKIGEIMTQFEHLVTAN